MDRLFLIVRADLSPADQAVQAAHALQAFNNDHPSIAKEWTRSSNTLALLTCVDLLSLDKLSFQIEHKGHAVARFFEADLDNQLTAIAVAPSAAALVRKLPLALQNPKQ